LIIEWLDAKTVLQAANDDVAGTCKRGALKLTEQARSAAARNAFAPVQPSRMFR